MDPKAQVPVPLLDEHHIRPGVEPQVVQALPIFVARGHPSHHSGLPQGKDGQRAGKPTGVTQGVL